MRVFFAVLLLLAPLVARAHDPAPLSRPALEAALREDGLALTLPAEVVATKDAIFDTPVLTLHLGGDSIVVGLLAAGDQSACSLDALVAKEKDEKGFVEVVRRGSNPAIPAVASSIRDGAGHEVFIVASCVKKTRAICVADKLTSKASLERAFAVCSTLRGVPAQPDERAYLGTYQVVFVDGDAGDRAAGRGGSGKRVRATLELTHPGALLSARYAVGPSDAPKLATSANLSEVVIQGRRFSAAPINVKAAWPYYLPAHFDGYFEGTGVLVLDGKRYERVH